VRGRSVIWGLLLGVGGKGVEGPVNPATLPGFPGTRAVGRRG